MAYIQSDSAGGSMDLTPLWVTELTETHNGTAPVWDKSGAFWNLAQ